MIQFPGGGEGASENGEDLDFSVTVLPACLVSLVLAICLANRHTSTMLRVQVVELAVFKLACYFVSVSSYCSILSMF
jgi:hypothetical protein